MQINELFEDAQGDVQSSQFAEMTLRALILSLEEKGFSRGNENRVYAPKFTTDNRILNSLITHLKVIFTSGVNSGFAISDIGIPFMELGVGSKLSEERVIAFLNGKGASTFRHEFQHFLDNTWKHNREVKTRYDAKAVVGKARDRRREIDTYFNDPQELNAYFHELAEPMLKILRAASQNDFDAVKEAGTVDPDFRAYLKHQMYWQADSQTWQFYQALTEDNRKKIIKRLYALHTAATALQGVASPYELSRKQKVLTWLQRALKGLGVTAAMLRVDQHLTDRAKK